ncbi:hypothetical protein J6590_065149 [Homalodisca vitripennis]|nr:hypothetical protein J6590_065149 [Homalodisca vitripennis]
MKTCLATQGFDNNEELQVCIIEWLRSQAAEFYDTGISKLAHHYDVSEFVWAWVPVSSCFLYSKLSPTPASNKSRRNLEECLQELEHHIKKLRDKFGRFEYPPYKTPYDPKNEDAQLAMFLPMYEVKVPGKRMMRISLHHDGARKSLLQQKPSTSSEGKKVTQDVSTEADSLESVQSSSSNKQATKDSQVNGSNIPMVVFPFKSVDDKETSESENTMSVNETENGSASKKPKTSQTIKKTYKVPLTAAAKKCFATEEKSCIKCYTKVTLEWSIDSGGKSLCSSCTLSPNKTLLKKDSQKDKCCARCQAQTTDSWHQTEGGDLFCASCYIKETEKPDIEMMVVSYSGGCDWREWKKSSENSIMRVTAIGKDEIKLKHKTCAVCHTHIAMCWTHNSDGKSICSSCGFVRQPLKNDAQVDDPFHEEAATNQEKEETGKVLHHEETNGSETTEDWTAGNNSISRLDHSTAMEVPTDDGAGGDKTRKEDDNVTQHRPVASGDSTMLDFVAVDSPPKFLIPKSSEAHSPEPSKKPSIVDRLQEKMWFAVEEALKGSGDKNASVEENVRSEENKSDETNVEKSIDEQTLVTKDMPAAKVVLHDISDITKSVDKTGTNGNQNKMSKETELEAQSSSETGSEPDTDVSSSIESDSCVNNEEVTKKKKQNNINNVVRTLQERKNSVEESNDQTNKNPNTKEPNTLMLDDSSDEIPVLIIDEGEDNPDDHNKPFGKSDKSRRKGIPAKVFSRSSTSTESSETSSPDEHSKKSKIVTEVLDEVSGQFRRSSGESNVTITLVTDEATPQKKKSKEIRSVNISKSLSLSVVNDTSSNLEMDCVESDLDDPVVVDSTVKKVNPRPTARKTLPNPPKPIELPSQQEKASSDNQIKETEPDIVKLRPTQTLIDPSTPPPPLINLQQAKVYGPPKIQNGGTPAVPRLVSVKPPPRQDIGPANAQIEEAITQMSSQLRTLLEDMLRGVSEAGATEATVKALQIELERLQWRHRQELAELKHNTDLMVMEIRASMEAEKQRALLDSKHKHEMEKEQAIQETKRKQWCAFCLKEAQLYCCWNTAYCSYNCQQSHWLPHMNSCLNKQHQDNNVTEPSPRGGLTRPAYNLPPGQVGYLINP